MEYSYQTKKKNYFWTMKRIWKMKKINKSKQTLVIGASIKPERYSNKAIRKLKAYGHPVFAVGLREGEVDDVPIRKAFPIKETIHTVTMYVGPDRQPPLYESILQLKPQRIIFNPGTENPVFQQQAQEKGIETIEDCTLVMMDTGKF